MKISMPCLRLSSSGVTDTRVKMFHISLSDTQKGPPIAWAAWCCHLKTARERVKEATISTTKFAWCIELIIGIDTSYLKWSQETKKGILWYQISKFFLNRWKVYQKKKNMITAIISFDLFLLSRQLFHLPQKKRQLFHLIKKSL